MDADKNEAGAGADQLANDWAKLPDERPLAELMHDATLAQMDPARDHVDGDNRLKYAELRRRFEALSPAARDVYARARDTYRQHMRDVRSAIKERIERAEMSSERRAAMLKRLDDEFFGHIKGVYFPLARFGQYVVVVKGADGKVANVSRAETMAEADTTRRQLLAAFPQAKGFTVGKVLKAKDFVAERDSVGRGFMEQLYGVLDKQGMDAKQRAELEDALGQLYLSSLPDLSWAKHGTYDGHFDYSANNRPRVMQGNVARVLLLFKQYGQNMVYTLARNAQQSLQGATPEARAEARKALGGLLAMHGMAAGVLGLPMVTTLLAAASMLGGDDDEPWDAQVALQNLLADTFGQKPAEVLAHGLSRLTPWDISGRVGLDKLIFPDVQEGLEGQRLAESAMTAALGPVAGIGINALKGLQEMSEGRYQRGLETMAPSVLRGPLKALRYESEGARDKSGIVVQDEVDAMALWGQAAGFSPSSVRNAYEGKAAIVAHDRALMARRSGLVEQFAMAAMAGDEAGKAEAREAIQRFNDKNPNRRILPMQLAQSVASRQKRIREAQEGVYLPSKRRDAVEQGRFAVSD